MKLQFIIDAEDKTKTAVKSVQGNLDKLQDKMKSMKPAFQRMALAGTAAFAAIGAGIWKTTEAFMKQEKAEARLAHLTKQTTGATDIQIQALKDQAAALQQVGVVGDEVTMVGQSQLATFALTTDQIAMLTPSLLDMVVATKGVNATQEDMINTGNALGRAIDGGAGALTRYGISLTDAQKELYTTATREERIIMLSQILQDNFGGLNEATRDTAEGGVTALNNSFGDLMEEIGFTLIPVLETLTAAIAPVIEKLSAWIQENPQLTKIIIIGTLALSGLLAVVGLIGLAIPPLIAGIGLLGGAFTVLLGPIGLVIAIITAVIAIGVMLWKNWDTIKWAAKMFWEAVTGYFKNLKQDLSNVWDSVKKTFTDTWDSIVAYFDKIWEGMGNIVSSVWETIQNTIKNNINWVIDKINWMIRQANEVAKMVPGAPVIAEIARLAEGGIVTKPTFAMVGEEGPEAVIPLNRGLAGAGVGIGGGITINVMGGNYLSDDAAEMFGEKLADEFKRNMKL